MQRIKREYTTVLPLSWARSEAKRRSPSISRLVAFRLVGGSYRSMLLPHSLTLLLCSSYLNPLAPHFLLLLIVQRFHLLALFNILATASLLATGTLPAITSPLPTTKNILYLLSPSPYLPCLSFLVLNPIYLYRFLFPRELTGGIPILVDWSIDWLIPLCLSIFYG